MGIFAFLFGKKKKQEPVEPKVMEEPTPVMPAIEPQPASDPQVPVEPQVETAIEPVATPEESKPAETPTVVEPKIVAASKPIEPTKPVEPVAPEKPVKPKAVGKYEVYPEAGLFKYRLKANNGEILVVSGGYTTAAGAINGIETFKKNVETGQFEIVTDKNNYAQFRLYTPNGSRQIAVGEFYETPKRAESAMESVKKFAGSEKIVELEEIPADEIREELVECNPVEKKQNGKLEIANAEGTWNATLKASNSEILFVTAGYSSKASLLSGLEAIKKAIEAHNFRVAKDKQGRWQFKLYSPNNQSLLVGETYGTKDAALSSIESVRRFASDAKQIEL